MTGFWPPHVEFDLRDVTTVMYVLEQQAKTRKRRT